MKYQHSEQVVVKIFNNLPEAELARNLLEAERVWSMLRGGNLSAYDKGGAGTYLFVKVVDLERARLLLGIE